MSISVFSFTFLLKYDFIHCKYTINSFFSMNKQNYMIIKSLVLFFCIALQWLRDCQGSAPNHELGDARSTCGGKIDRKLETDHLAWFWMFFRATFVILLFIVTYLNCDQWKETKYEVYRKTKRERFKKIFGNCVFKGIQHIMRD